MKGEAEQIQAEAQIKRLYAVLIANDRREWLDPDDAAEMARDLYADGWRKP